MCSNSRLIIMLCAVVVSAVIPFGTCSADSTLPEASKSNTTVVSEIAQRSVRVSNYGNWRMLQSPDHTSPKKLEEGLLRLARRSDVCYTENYEHVNYTPGWSKLTPQSIKAINPSTKVYRLYCLMAKPDWDTDWINPSDTTRMGFPLTKAMIDANNWWLRDGEGRIVTEAPNGYFIDVGKPGVKEAYLQAVLSRNSGKGFDGFVFDYWWPSISRWVDNQGFSRPAAYPTDADWYNKAWKPFISYVTSGVRKAGYRVIGNCAGEYMSGDPGKDWQRTQIDGVVYEQGAVDWSGSGSRWLAGSIIERRINALASDPLEVWFTNEGIRSTLPDYERKQIVSLAVYYAGIPLSQSRRTYHEPGNETVHWEALWDFYIGVPAEASATKKPGRYFWSRKFTQGIVLLNYEEVESITYVLDKTYRDYKGTAYSGSVTLSPHTALILASE